MAYDYGPHFIGLDPGGAWCETETTTTDRQGRLPERP